MAEKKRSHHKKKEPSQPKPVKKIPRQKQLPGMEDAKIAAIENLALDYAELRDQRVALSAKEIDLKDKLMKKMHALGKTSYKRNGIEVKLTVEKEGVKVRVKSEDDLPTDIEPAPAPNVSEESLAVSAEG